MTSGHLRQPVGWYVAWAGSVVFAFFGLWYAYEIGWGYDSHAYWLAVQDMDHLYGAPALSRDAYLYSPAFAQAIWPLGRLPWPAFWVVWSCLLLAAFVWLLRPLPARWFAPAVLAVLPEVVTGNIYALMAAALVLGTSRGISWSFIALTKVTPGAVGFAWFVGQRSWRGLAEAVVTTAALTGVSYAAMPQQWWDLGRVSYFPQRSVSVRARTRHDRHGINRGHLWGLDAALMGSASGRHPREPHLRSEHSDAARGAAAAPSGRLRHADLARWTPAVEHGDQVIAMTCRGPTGER